MRSALVSTALAAGLALGGAPLLAAPAWAPALPAAQWSLRPRPQLRP